jgi:hypothetical protein
MAASVHIDTKIRRDIGGHFLSLPILLDNQIMFERTISETITRNMEGSDVHSL